MNILSKTLSKTLSKLFKGIKDFFKIEDDIILEVPFKLEPLECDGVTPCNFEICSGYAKTEKELLIEKVKKLKSTKMSNKSIATELGISTATVAKYIKL